jgi:TusA-related sulfurtransferase
MTDNNTPEPDAVLDAPGSSCANLTPLIRARIRELTSGQLLEVRTDDPAAREGVPAWSRLTGNALEAVVEDDAERTRFYLRRK